MISSKFGKNTIKVSIFLYITIQDYHQSRKKISREMRGEQENNLNLQEEVIKNYKKFTFVFNLFLKKLKF